MDTEKMDGLSMNIEETEREKLRSVFPQCFNEGKLDIDKLLSLCGEYITDDFEKYEFRWKGKSECVQLAGKRSAGTLRPCPEESVDWDTTKNLYIEGDNLEVLKLLQTSYYRKVKMIYIDPPYNTGNDFVYADDFADPLARYKEVTQQTTKSNPETMGRFHTNWLNMMYPRLRLAANLLRDDGVIFISIDDGELHNLRKLCDEVFGEENFITDISWQRTYSSRNDSLGVVVEVEHILAYSKQPNWSPNKLPRTEEMNSKYSSPDNDDRLWTSSSISAPGAVTHQGMVYAIQHPFTGEMMYPTAGRCWTLGQDQILENMQKWCDYEVRNLGDAKKRAEICGITEEVVRQDVKGIVLSDSIEISRQKAQAVYDKGKWPYFYFTDGGKGGIRRKTYLDDMGGRLPTNFWSFSEVGHTDEAKKELKALFDGNIPFDTPKPIRLIDRMLTIATEPDSIILDFFSGSATTAHAVMKKNAGDGGNRRFIMVQLPEISRSAEYNTLCEIGKERIRRAGAKIRSSEGESRKKENGQLELEENTSELQLPTSDLLDTGFRVFKLDSSNLKIWNDSPITGENATTLFEQRLFDYLDVLVPDRTAVDVVYEVMLKLGQDLCEPITEIELSDGRTVYGVGADVKFIVCLAPGITPEDASIMADYAPGRIVFAEQCFETTEQKSNVRLTLKDLGISIKTL